jgi:hypothetical protein
MIRFALIWMTMTVFAASASAQSITTISGDDAGVQLTGPEERAAEDTSEKRKVYDKRVGGIVWLEATAGPSRFDVTRFRSLDIIPSEFASAIPSVVVSGPELGAALKFRAGSSTIGAQFKRANYEAFDLTSIGLDLGFLVRAVPYVHPAISLGFGYYTTGSSVPIPQYADFLTDVKGHGGGASIGAGLRIPVVRWISIAADFEYSIIGLVFRGDLQGGVIPGVSGSFTAGTAGTAIAGNFALTFHLGG